MEDQSGDRAAGDALGVRGGSLFWILLRARALPSNRKCVLSGIRYYCDNLRLTYPLRRTL